MRSPREAGSQIAHRQKQEALALAKEPEPKQLEEPEPKQLAAAEEPIAHRQKPEALAPAKEPEPKPRAPAKEPEPIADWQKPEAIAPAKEALVLAKAAKEPDQASNEQKGCSLSCSIFWAIRSRCD